MERIMDWQIALIIPGIAVVLGAIGYGIHRYIDWEVDKNISGKLEVIKKRHLDKYNAIVDLQGLLSEIAHCIGHIEKKDKDYEYYYSKCLNWCDEMRNKSRRYESFIGYQIKNEIHSTTDIALKIAKLEPGDHFQSWHDSYIKLNNKMFNQFKDID
jgi:hypothetical protein